MVTTSTNPSIMSSHLKIKYIYIVIYNKKNLLRSLLKSHKFGNRRPAFRPLQLINIILFKAFFSSFPICTITSERWRPDQSFALDEIQRVGRFAEQLVGPPFPSERKLCVDMIVIVLFSTFAPAGIVNGGRRVVVHVPETDEALLVDQHRVLRRRLVMSHLVRRQRLNA